MLVALVVLWIVVITLTWFVAQKLTKAITLIWALSQTITKLRQDVLALSEQASRPRSTHIQIGVE